MSSAQYGWKHQWLKWGIHVDYVHVGPWISRETVTKVKVPKWDSAFNSSQQIGRDDSMRLGSKTFLTPAMTLEALLGSLQCTCVVHLWRLPSLVCEHITLHDAFQSLASTMSLLRAWLTNGIESLSCPPPSFSFLFSFSFYFLMIDFWFFLFCFFFFTTCLNYAVPHMAE